MGGGGGALLATHRSVGATSALTYSGAREGSPPMTMFTDSDQEAQSQEAMILDSVGRFLDREVKPYVHALEHDDIYPEEIVEGMKALGLFGATIGADYGGLGLPAGTYARI